MDDWSTDDLDDEHPASTTRGTSNRREIRMLQVVLVYVNVNVCSGKVGCIGNVSMR